MKSLFLITFFLFISTIISSQKINQEISIENQQPFLVGEINIEGLSSTPYKECFQPNSASYSVSTTNLEQIKDKLAEYKILIFIGTWCGDSKREVTRFIKILESVDYPMKNLKIVAVDNREISIGKAHKARNGDLTYVVYQHLFSIKMEEK